MTSWECWLTLNGNCLSGYADTICSDTPFLVCLLITCITVLYCVIAHFRMDEYFLLCTDYFSYCMRVICLVTSIQPYIDYLNVDSKCSRKANSLCLSLPVSHSLSLTLSIALYLSPCLCLYLSVSLYISLSLSLSLSISLCLYLSVSVSVSLSLSASISLCLYLCLSLSLSLSLSAF